MYLNPSKSLDVCHDLIIQLLNNKTKDRTDLEEAEAKK